MRTRLLLGGVAVVLVAILMLAGGPAEAKKPPKPPPEPPPQVDTGTIYFHGGDDVYAMDPDGSNKTALASVLADYGPCEPSAKLHDCDDHSESERWFLQLRPFDSNPNDQVTETYPNGLVRHELYAVCEGGETYRLTSDLNLEIDIPVGRAAQVRWFKNDTRVSYLAKRWVEDPVDGWVVTEWGIHELTIDPANLEDHVPGVPTRVDVPLTLMDPNGSKGGYLDAAYDWKPDGTALVYKRRQVGLVRADYANDTWSTTLLPVNDGNVRWSPTTSRILVMNSGNIVSLDPYNPTDRTTLIEDPADHKKGRWAKRLAWPLWSPNATHIIYQWEYLTTYPEFSGEYDVRRATSSGSDDTNLTGDIDGYVSPLGWR